MIAPWIDQVLMLLTGIWACAVGYDALPPPVPGPQWIARFRLLFRVAGPLLIVLAVTLTVAELMH